MLIEYKKVQQKKNEPRRRWFSDNYFDLIVWFDNNDEIIGFQLCYEINKDERALTWEKGVGYYHNKVDDGNRFSFGGGRTPILIQDGMFDYVSIANRFENEIGELENRIAEFVYDKIIHYSE